MGEVTQKEPKITLRTQNFEVAIDENTGRKLKVSVDPERKKFIIHGVQGLLKELDNKTYSSENIDQDIRDTEGLFKHTMALLYSARNHGRVSIDD